MIAGRRRTSRFAVADHEAEFGEIFTDEMVQARADREDAVAVRSRGRAAVGGRW